MLSPKIRQARRGKSDFLRPIWAQSGESVGRWARILGWLHAAVTWGGRSAGILVTDSLGTMGVRPDAVRGRWPI